MVIGGLLEAMLRFRASSSTFSSCRWQKAIAASSSGLSSNAVSSSFSSLAIGGNKSSGSMNINMNINGNSAQHAAIASTASTQQQRQRKQQQSSFSTTTTTSSTSTSTTTTSTSAASAHQGHKQPEIVDFFGLFGLPRKFGLPPASELKGTYHQLMIEHHPDKKIHNNKDDDNKDDDNAITAELITHAYQTLRAPHTRACHWLELHGCPLMEYDNNNSTNSTNSTNNNNDNTAVAAESLVDTDFLMEMMEWRERIEDAGTQQDSLRAIGEETQRLQASCEASMEQIMRDDNDNDNDNDNEAPPNQETLQQARRLTAQLQYWNRLEETLKEAMDV